jgi:hypothetical protein
VKIRAAAERQRPLAFCPPGEFGSYAALYEQLRCELERRIAARWGGER